MTMKPSGRILLVLGVGAGLASCAPQEQADFEEVDALQSTAPTQTGQTRVARAQLIDSEGGPAGTIISPPMGIRMEGHTIRRIAAIRETWATSTWTMREGWTSTWWIR